MFGRKTKQAPTKRTPDTNLEDLRDDCIALYRDSGKTMKQVHADGGPTPQTISRWLYRETKFPRLDTMRALVQALGAEMVIMPRFRAEQYRQNNGIAVRLGLQMSVDSQPKMPPRPKKKSVSARKRDLAKA